MSRCLYGHNGLKTAGCICGYDTASIMAALPEPRHPVSCESYMAKRMDSPERWVTSVNHVRRLAETTCEMASEGLLQYSSHSLGFE